MDPNCGPYTAFLPPILVCQLVIMDSIADIQEEGREWQNRYKRWVNAKRAASLLLCQSHISDDWTFL
jgi:hypothetical protein